MYPYLYETTPRFIINGVVSYYAIPSDLPVLPIAANIRIVFTACPLSMDKVLSKAYRLVKQSYFLTRSFVCICCKNSPITGCLSAQIPFCIISCCEVGTEELAHWEMLGAMIHQCMAGASCQELTEAGLAGYYTMHNHGVYPADPNGVPYTTAFIQVTGDPITDLVEDMAADAAITQEQHGEKNA